MDNTISPPLAHGRLPGDVLGVTELLEHVLINLEPADILYNAQAVCSFWKECIQGSNAIKKKCFLVADEISEKDTDRLLFLGSHLPDLGKTLLAEWRHYGDTEDLCRLTKVTPVTLRALFAGDPLDRRLQYKSGIYDYFNKLDDAKESIPLTMNVGREGCELYHDREYDVRIWESLLDMSRLNPLLRQSWRVKASAAFTGYEKHIIFALGDNSLDGCEYFTYIREFLETFVNAMSTNESRQPWKTLQISSPAATELTVTISLPAGDSDAHYLLCYTGITMIDFARAFIIAVR